MHHKKTAVCALISATLMLTACSYDFSSLTSIVGGSDKNTEEDTSYLSKLESGTYYVRHSDNTCDPVYLGDASFDEGDTVNNPNDNRTVWYRDDKKEIPTLYMGDDLIMYSTEEFDETFIFERFEEYGYTFGIRHLQSTESGRYKISTDPDDRCTYPEGDTDAILELTNDNVILDSISGVPFREPEENENGDYVTESLLTRSNTIKNLDEGKKYDVEVYNGTKGYTYTWKADVWVLGSMEVETTHKFSFESETIITIDIPSGYHSGYYMINGQGLFRYVADGQYYDANTDFNVPNFDENNEGSSEADLTNVGESGVVNAYDESNNSSTDLENGEKGNSTQYRDSAVTSSFNLESIERIVVNAKINGAQSTEELQEISAIVVSPSGNRIQMNRFDTTFTSNIMPDEAGLYQIEIYGLSDNMTAEISVNYTN